jgi:hypothetical protein
MSIEPEFTNIIKHLIILQFSLSEFILIGRFTL